MLRGVSQKARKNFSFLVVVITTVLLILVNFALPFQKQETRASTQASLSKTSTDDWDKGAHAGVDSTADELKLNKTAGWGEDSYAYREQLPITAKADNAIPKGFTLNAAGVGSGTFDGSGDYFNTGDSLNATTLPVTIEAWVKITGAAPNGNGWAIFASDDGATLRYYGFWMLVDQNRNVFLSYGSGGGQTSLDRRSKVSTGTVTLDTWTHITGVIRGATDMSIYLNGVDAGGAYSGTGGTMAHSADAAKIGARSIAVTPQMRGNIDELRIWSKERTTNEISADMLKEIAAQSNLEAYYKFNQTSGTLADDSGHGLTGTAVGDATYSPYSNVWGGVNTKTLIDSGKMRSDGNDLRMFYGSTEIERELIPATGQTLATSEATQVLFKSQEAIAPGATDSSYYLYYGDSDATDPIVNVYDKKFRTKNAYITPFAGAGANYLQYNGDNFPTNGDGTLEFWYKHTNAGSRHGTTGPVFSGEDTQNIWSLWNDRWGYRNFAYIGGVAVIPSDPGNYNDGRGWNHTVITWHNTVTNSQIRMYENNVLTASVDDGTKITSWPNYMKFIDNASSYDGIQLGLLAAFNTAKDNTWVASEYTRSTPMPIADGSRDSSATFIHNFDGSGLDAAVANGGYASGTATAVNQGTIISGDYRQGDTHDERAGNNWASGVYNWYDNFDTVSPNSPGVNEFGKINVVSNELVVSNGQQAIINQSSATMPTSYRVDVSAKGTQPEILFNHQDKIGWWGNASCAVNVASSGDNTTDLLFPRDAATGFLSSNTSKYYLAIYNGWAPKYLQFDLSINGSYTGLVWEYWNGSAWTAFTPASDGTANFTKSGVVDISNISASYGASAPADGSCGFNSNFNVIRVSASAVTTQAMINQINKIWDFAKLSFSATANVISGDSHNASGNVAITRSTSAYKQIGLKRIGTAMQSYADGRRIINTSTNAGFDSNLLALSATTDATYDNLKIYKALADEPNVSHQSEDLKYHTGATYLSSVSTAEGSGIIDGSWIGGWGSPNGFTANVVIPTNTSIDFSIRSSAVAGVNDSDWTGWAVLGSATTSGTFSVANTSMPGITLGTNRYLQIRAVFNTTDGLSTPVLSDYTINYIGDSDAPSNPTVSSVTVNGAAVNEGDWTNHDGNVVVNFSGSVDPGTESGIAGYYLYLGTSDSANPVTAGTYQAHQGAAGDVQTFNSTISTSDDGKYYYLIISVIDVARNISDPLVAFDFGYDISAPARPSFVASNPAGYTTNNSFSFSWPAAEDTKTANGWYNNSWAKRQKITFDKDKVPNTDQTDFPVLVKITDANNELFTTAKTNGYDILFTSVDKTTKLSHEIEKYDAVTHELWAWVKLPVLSHTIDTNIYMYYGNASAASQQNKTDVWTNGYDAAYHMGQASLNHQAGDVIDSSSNAYNGTSFGDTSTTAGKIGNAGNFDGEGDYITAPVVTAIDGKYSMGGWFYLDSYQTNNNSPDYGARIIVDSKNASYDVLHYMSVYGISDGKYSAGFNWNIYIPGQNRSSVNSSLTAGLGSWHYLSAVYDQSSFKLYKDGVIDSSPSSTFGAYATTQISMGRFAGPNGGFWDGYLDEIRLSSIARTADWIAAEYANQNDPETFMEISPSSGGSDIKYYQYKKASDENWSQTDNSATRTVAGITAYREGANAFYVRAVDNADNYSETQQVTYYWSGSAPAKPANLSVSPETSDSNSFTISWDKSIVDSNNPEVVGYYYSVNAFPTIQNVTYAVSADDRVSVGPSPFATLQGTNTVYVVGVNSAGNLSFESDYVASVTFSCQTPAPPAPTSVALYDSSDRVLDRWMLTLQWIAGEGQNAETFDHYLVERSTNGTDFSSLATTTSTAYIDSLGLNNSTTYSYRVKAVDNAGKESAASSIVQRQPAGKYLMPPAFLSQPVVSQIKSNGSVIAWTTDRASTSVVRYGTNEANMAFSTGNFENVTNHQISLLGLKPSATYYFQVQSMDEDRDYEPEDAYSKTFTFITLPAPAISNVNVENITLTTADISFETTTVSNSVINYGKSTTYDSSIEDKSGAGTISHRVKISALSSSSVYHFKIKGTDIDGNNLVSDDYSFETLSPPRLEGLKQTPVEGEASYTTKVTWSTNVEATTILRYAANGIPSKEVVSAKMTKDHEVVISDLLDNATYLFEATGRDQFGNAASSATLQITTPLDSRPPKISDVNFETNINGNTADAKSQIIVSWKTDELAASQVEFGEGTGSEGYPNSSQPNQSLSKDHIVIISDLDNQKPYHLRAVSKDAAGNSAYSENTVVVTKKPKQAAFTLILDTLGKSFGFLSKILRF